MEQLDLTRSISFKTAETFFDETNKTFQINWIGNVDFEDYKKVLLEAVKLADEGKLKSLILNRLNLIELNVECRIWLKNDLLKVHAKPIIPKLSKVATIESKTALGRLYTNTITKTVSLVYPNLSFKSFSSEKDAHNWIKGTAAKSPVVKRKKVVDRKPVIRTEDPVIKPENKEKFLTRFVDFLLGSRKPD